MTRPRLPAALALVPLAAAAALHAACGALAAEPRPQDVLSVVTLSFGGDGALDRAVLTQAEDRADLAIYRAVPAPEAGAPLLAPAFAKRNIVWSGQMWGTLPSLSVNARGSLVIASENDAIGRDRWHQALTVAYRDNQYLVVGLTRDFRDTLKPASGGSCDLNLSTGRGTADGKPVALPLAPVPLADWSDDKLPKACGG